MKVSEFAKWAAEGKLADRGVYVVGQVGKGKTPHILNQWERRTLCDKPGEKTAHLLETDDRDVCLNCARHYASATKTIADYPARTVEIPGLSGLGVTFIAHEPATNTKGETEMPKTDTDALTAEQITDEVKGNIERIRSLLAEGNEEGARELERPTEALISGLNKEDGKADQAARKKLRIEMAEALKAKPAPQAEPEPEPEPAPSTEVATLTKWEDIPAVVELVQMGADKALEGFRSLKRGSEVAQEIGSILLDMRVNIVNPKTGLPDLRADSDEAKRASRDMYATVEASLKAEAEKAGEEYDASVLSLFKRSVQNQTQHIVVHYVNALDNSPEEVAAHFAKALERNPELSPTEAVRKECKIPEKSGIDKDREAKQRKAALAKAKLALEGGEDAPEMDPEEAKAIVDAATVAPIEKAKKDLEKASKLVAEAMKLAAKMDDADIAALKEMISGIGKAILVAETEI